MKMLGALPIMSELEQLLHTDFKVFLTAIWAELGLPEPTRAQYAIADYLQHGPKRLQIQAFRGVGKSWIAGAFVIWILFNNPEKKILIISASKERADNQSIFIQRLLNEVEWLQHLLPTDDSARWSRVSFDIKCSPHQAPSVKSAGITGQLAGSRADIILLDDIEVPNNSLTELMREKLLQLCTEAESILTPKEDSRILYLGTPQTVFSVYRKLAERGYRPLIWPSRYPRDLSKYPEGLAQQLGEDLDRDNRLEWRPTDPMRFGEDDLLMREASMGRSNFMLQFMLDTSLSDAEKFPLKLADLIITGINPTQAPDGYVWAADPRNCINDLPLVGLPGDRFYSPMSIQGEWAGYQQTIVSVDPSGRGKDETTAWALSQKNGFIYGHEMFASREGYTDATLLSILRMTKKYGATTLLIESNFGDGMITELFRKHIRQMKLAINIEEVRATTNKESRIIDTLEPVLNQHRLVIDRKVVEYDFHSNQDAEDRSLYMLFYQMSRMCREKGAVKFDDRIDCLAQGVAYYTEAMGLSAQEVINNRRHEDWKLTMDMWIEDPEQAVNHMGLGMTLEQRHRAISATSTSPLSHISRPKLLKRN
jgi:hypothetical protein